jgi:hypothetical protein
MNERISELKAQCISREVRGTNAFDSYVVNKFDSEKFAELIVRECAGRVDWILAEGGKTQGDLIREQFGVE